MSKSINQKLKILYIMQYLLNNSDENHPVTTLQIIDHLNSIGINCERKTVYSDIELLTEYGLDIIYVKGKEGGYFISSREFELPELKILVDSVQSSKFITEAKSRKLIRKLERLTNKYDAEELHKQVCVINRVKSINEMVYINVDIVAKAINENSKIQFKYFRYNINKEKEFRHNGLIYEVSPFALILEEENYYMLGYDSNSGLLKHYRVDKMEKLKATGEKREGKEEFDKIDIASYNTRVFSMFGGDAEFVKIKFCNELINPVIDRFGKNVFVNKIDDGHFTVEIKVEVSPQFYAWIFGFGNQCEILAPQSVRDKMVDLASHITETYKQ